MSQYLHVHQIKAWNIASILVGFVVWTMISPSLTFVRATSSRCSGIYKKGCFVHHIHSTRRSDGHSSTYVDTTHRLNRWTTPKSQSVRLHSSSSSSTPQNTPNPTPSPTPNPSNHNNPTTTPNPLWNKLHQPKTVLAPMVAQSDLPFRHLARSYNTDLCYTQMIHAENFLKSETFQDAYLDVYRTPTNKDRHVLPLSPSGWTALQGLDWEDYIRRQEEMMEKKNGYGGSSSSCSSFLDETWMDFAKEMASSSTFASSSSSSRIPAPHHWGTYTESSSLHTSSSTSSSSSPSPLIVQLAGHNPNTVSQTAQIILSKTNSDTDHLTNAVAGIDINCGCPQAIARKGRYGAFLMEESVDIVCQVLKQLRKDVPTHIGVSAKIRIPRGVELDPYHVQAGNLNKMMKQSKGALELATRIQKLIDAGVDIITIHGRTIDENKTKVRGCNWDAIAFATQVAREYTRGTGHCPAIIANGGIEFTSDVQKCLDYTGADAVMSSESLLENPGIFSSWNVLGGMDEVPTSSMSMGMDTDVEGPLAIHDVRRMHPKVLFAKQLQYCHEYLDLCIRFPPLPGSLGKVGGSFNCIRGHLFKMLYRYLEEHPDLRTLLGHSSQTCRIQQARELLYEMEGRYQGLSDQQWMELKSSDVVKGSWYRRHRVANENVRARGQRVTVAEASEQAISIEERKRLMKERISQLKKKNAEKVTI